MQPRSQGARQSRGLEYGSRSTQWSADSLELCLRRCQGSSAYVRSPIRESEIRSRSRICLEPRCGRRVRREHLAALNGAPGTADSRWPLSVVAIVLLARFRESEAKWSTGMVSVSIISARATIARRKLRSPFLPPTRRPPRTAGAVPGEGNPVSAVVSTRRSRARIASEATARRRGPGLPLRRTRRSQQGDRVRSPAPNEAV